MRRFFSGLTILLFLFVLIACGNNVSEIIDEMDLIFDGGDTINNITQDFKVTVTSSNEDATIRWESSDPNTIRIVGDNAIVTRQPHITQVTLTVTITIGRNSDYKDFIVTVLEEEINTYTIKFNTGTDIVYDDISVNEGSLAYSPGTPVIEGHTFLGWFLGDKLFDFNTPIRSDISLDANFEINKHNIVYRVDGEIYKEETYEFGEEVEILDDLEKLGYSFSWNQTLPEIMPDYTLDVYGTFSLETYNITYTNYEGNHNNRTSYNVTDEFNLNLPPAKPGYTVDGWYLDDEKITKIKPGMAGDITLEARYNINSYKVIYNVNGNLYKEESFEFGKPITIIPDLDEEGYMFEGWDIELPETMPASNITVNGVLTPIEYNITYTNLDEYHNNPDIYTVEDEIVLTDPIERFGYTFDGWYLGDEKITVIEKGSVGDIVLEAKFSVRLYTITFDTDGGTLIDPITLEFGSVIGPVEEPSKEGHDFLMWYPEIPNTMPSQDMVIEALYHPHEFEITFDENITVQATQNISSGDLVYYDTKLLISVTVPVNMEIDDLIINGDVVTGVVNNRYELTVVEDIYVTVTFRQRTNFNVEFDPNNGDDTFIVIVEKETAATEPVAPDRYGYIFTGWMLEDVLYDFDTLVTEDILLVAAWQQLFEQVIETYDFGTSNNTGYDSPSFSFTNTGGSSHTLTKQRAQINSSPTNDPHKLQGPMLVMAPVSDKGSGISFVEFDFSSIENLSKVEFQFAAWNANALNRISGFSDAVFYFQVQDGGSWTTLSDSNNTKNLLTYFESGNHVYNWVTFNNLQAGKYRLYYNAPGANTTSIAQALVVDDLSVSGFFEVANGNVVTFDYNYEGGPSSFISIVEDNQLVSEPSEPNRLGYDFLGWFDGNDEFDFNTPITKSLTLTANWQQSKLVIIFDFGSGDIEDYIELIELNEKVVEIVEPQREGYTFVGWYQTAIGETYNNEFDFDTILDSNVRLYAKWQIIEPAPLIRDDNLLDNYYETVVGLNDEDLVFELREILIQTHQTPTSYGDARYILDDADKTLYDDTLMLGIYYRATINATWDNGLTWAREHVWPNSKLGIERVENSDRNQGTDLHNLRAINPSINSTRSNRYFVNTTQNIPIGHTVGLNGFYPGDEDLGDVARILMYMVVRYDFLMLTDDETLLTLGTYSMNSAYMGMLNVLLDWHLTDPVDEFEISRNEVIYENQGNRNPFIDHPELFEEVFNYYVTIDEQRSTTKNMLITNDVNIYKIDINYNEFRNKREYVI